MLKLVCINRIIKKQMEEIKIELLKILTKKRLIAITIIWAIGFLLKLMADTNLFTENILQIKSISNSSMIFILVMHLFYWKNKKSTEKNRINEKVNGQKSTKN